MLMIMSNKQNLTLKTQRVVQNHQEFLIGVFEIKDILKFTRYTEFTILGFDEEDNNRPITRSEVQRKLIPSKVASIVDFLIHDPLAIFPTNLVISIPNHVIANQIEKENGIIEINLDSKVFSEIKKLDKNNSGDIYLSIIDGQHRIKGIEKTILLLEDEIKLNENLIRTASKPELYLKKLTKLKTKLDSIKNIQLPVTFFIDPVLEYQAMIFSTINRTQTKVPPDLVYSLFGLTKGDSPQKTVLNIVNTLNGKEGSPFYKRIRLAGSGTKEAKSFYKEGNPVLSQATVVKSILSMICKNRKEEEIVRHKERGFLLENPDRSLPFRKYYGQKEDYKILRIIYSFFLAVRKSFIQDGKSLWDFEEEDTRKPTNILQTTVGFLALLDLLQYSLTKIREDQNDVVEIYMKILSSANSIDFIDNNNPKKYPFTNKTRSLIFNDLGKIIWGEEFNIK
tara:strand:- start:3944 stop:5296 length:1353 start_codon:yes stop_codon:yes gene_type:complete